MSRAHKLEHKGFHHGAKRWKTSPLKKFLNGNKGGTGESYRPSVSATAKPTKTHDATARDPISASNLSICQFSDDRNFRSTSSSWVVCSFCDFPLPYVKLKHHMGTHSKPQTDLSALATRSTATFRLMTIPSLGFQLELKPKQILTA